MLHIGVCGIHVELFNLINVIKISHLDQCFVLWKKNCQNVNKTSLGKSLYYNFEFFSFFGHNLTSKTSAGCHQCNAWLGSITTYTKGHHCHVATFYKIMIHYHYLPLLSINHYHICNNMPG
jgi:hypothetical protein